MEEEEEEMGGTGTSLPGMRISSRATCICMGWSKTPLEIRGALDQMERKEGGDRTCPIPRLILSIVRSSFDMHTYA